jgi:hypothetical protein
VAEIDESASENEAVPTAADVADDEDIQVFDLDDIEVMESKVFG